MHLLRFDHTQAAPPDVSLLEMLCDRPTNRTAMNNGPLEALRKSGLCFKTKKEKAAWVAEARLDAILGSCQASVQSVKSGLRCYLAFAGECPLLALDNSLQYLCSFRV